MWHQTSVSKMLGIDYPVLQGPFGGNLSSSALVAAVSNAGGLGGYGAYSNSPEEIVAMDKEIKVNTDKPYNLNLWVSDTDMPGGGGVVTEEQYQQAVAFFRPYFEEAGIALPPKPEPFYSRFERQLQVVLDIRPRVFSYVFGTLTPDVQEQCRKRGIITIGTATTVEEALALEAAGTDMIVASGFEAGGHRPSFLEPAADALTGTFVLLQLIRERVKLPVIAAGGIATGRGIAAALMLGADAVQIGTAFLACEESNASPMHRQMLHSDRARHTMLTPVFTGRLGRGIRNKLAQELQGREAALLPFPLQSRFMAALRKASVEQEKWDNVLFWGGQIAPVLKHHKAMELMRALVDEANALYGSGPVLSGK